MAKKTKRLDQVFIHLMRSWAHLLRVYPGNIMGWGGFAMNEPLHVELRGNNVWAWRQRSYGHFQPVMILGPITPQGVGSLVYGSEAIQKSEVLGSRVSSYDNRDNPESVKVNFGDLFGQSDEKTDEKSKGGSLSVSVEASESIEGVAEFTESVTAEVHEEVSSSETQSSTSESSTDEETEIPAHSRMRITEVVSRANTSQEVTGRGQFEAKFQIGEWNHKGSDNAKLHRTATFVSLAQFREVMRGGAPSNWPMATVVNHRPPNHGDLWALNVQPDSEVRYNVSFEGKILRTFHVGAY